MSSKASKVSNPSGEKTRYTWRDASGVSRETDVIVRHHSVTDVAGNELFVVFQVLVNGVVVAEVP